MNTPSKVKADYGTFKNDLIRCLDKVTHDFPEFSDSKFSISIIFRTSSIEFLGIRYPILEIEFHPMDFVRDYTVFFGYLALCLSDDDRKEGVLAHELGELSHLKKKSGKALSRIYSWYDKDKKGYRTLVQKHADLDAARKGYGHKLIKALESYNKIGSTKDIESVNDRIKNLEGYLKK